MELDPVIIFLFIYICFLEIRHSKERKGLLDRIMAKNYNEYALHDLHKEEIKTKEKVVRDEGIPL